jgi:CheY-like chemotaxis protein
MAAAGNMELSQLAVLAADDHAINRDFLQVALGARVGRLELATTGREAVQACTRSEFDVILMDLHMPDLDGISAWERISRLPGRRRPRILALTADGRPDQRQRLRAHGFDGMLHKPVSIETLVGALHAVHADANAFVEPDDAAAEPPALLDSEQAGRAAGSDEAAARMQRALARELSDGLGQVDGLIADRRYAAAAELLHQWAGAAGYAGAARLREATVRLERCLRDGLDSSPGSLYFEWRRTLSATLAALADADA